MKVVWTNSAIEHLVAIYEHIAHDSPAYATRMVDRITRRSEQIAAFPESGAVVSEYDALEIRQVIESPYRIIYRIGNDVIEVIAVVHGARNWRGV